MPRLPCPVSSAPRRSPSWSGSRPAQPRCPGMRPAQTAAVMRRMLARPFLPDDVKARRWRKLTGTAPRHYLDKWISTSKLSKGEHPKTANGTVAVADGGTTPKVHDGWMWDHTVRTDH